MGAMEMEVEVGGGVGMEVEFVTRWPIQVGRSELCISEEQCDPRPRWWMARVMTMPLLGQAHPAMPVPLVG